MSPPLVLAETLHCCRTATTTAPSWEADTTISISATSVVAPAGSWGSAIVAPPDGRASTTGVSPGAAVSWADGSSKTALADSFPRWMAACIEATNWACLSTSPDDPPAPLFSAL